MKHFCIVHLDYAIFSAKSPGEVDPLGRSSAAYDAELAGHRQPILVHGLEPPENGLIVKVRNNEVSMTGGPFSKVEEQMAGIIIEARDINVAVGIATGIPLATCGQFEIQPIYADPTHA